MYNQPQGQFGNALPGYPGSGLPGYPMGAAPQQPMYQQYPAQPMQQIPPQPQYGQPGMPPMQNQYAQQPMPQQGYQQPPMQQYPGNCAPQQYNMGQQPMMQQPMMQQPGQPLQNQQDIMNCAQILRKAMKGLGTDEMAIIQVMKTHDSRQRAAIAESFCSQYGMTLDRELKKELSGNLEKICRGAFTDRYVYWAQHIDDAIRGAGTDEKRLIQLILLLSDQDNKIVS